MDLYAFMGKGGVGKSTLSVAFAQECLRRKQTPLVIGLDQQHNALDLIQQKGLKIDYENAFNRISAMVDFVIEKTFLKSYKTYAPLMAPDFKAICSLAEMLHIHAKQYDVVIMDFPPNHAGLSMVNMANVLHNSAFELMTVKNRIHKMVTGHDEVMERFEYLWEIVKEFKGYLAQCRFIPIGTPHQLDVLEVSKLIEFLHTPPLDYSPYKIIVNQVPAVDAGSDCLVCEKREIMANRFCQQMDELGIRHHVPVKTIPEELDGNLAQYFSMF